MKTLTNDEVDQVSGGMSINWASVRNGAALVGLGISIVVAAGLTGGLAVGVILGAGTVGELVSGGVALGLAGAGGYEAGSAITFD